MNRPETGVAARWAIFCCGTLGVKATFFNCRLPWPNRYLIIIRNVFRTSIDFDRELKILEEAVTFLPPIKDLNISNYVPENLRNNVLVNNEPLYFGARRLQKQADVGVEIKFNLNEAKWLKYLKNISKLMRLFLG